MREGALTEREWRKQSLRMPRREPRCWGAQCMAPQIQRKPHLVKRHSRYAAMTLAIVTLGIVSYFLIWFNTPTAEYPIMPALSEAVEALPQQRSVRANSAVAYSYPQVAVKEVTFTYDELLRGKVMLIDQKHPLPADAPGANTVCIATAGKGIVPVRDLSLKTGQQTIEALYNFFLFARQKGVEGLTISRGTLSDTEQRELQLERVRVHAASMPLHEAVEKARAEIDDPRTSDFQQQYTVDIRLYLTVEGAADQRPLGLTEQGRFLLQNAWRYGFIRRFPQENDNPYRAYQFRYVGVAHSTAMTFLDLDFESYLEYLHEKQVIQIHQEGAPKYLILCRPVEDGYVSFPVPENATYEAGYDNMGYAILACSFQDS